MPNAFIALGSNLNDPVKHLQRAIVELAALPNISLLATSKLYHNPPVGLIDQPHFVNGVVKVSTTLTPSDLLGKMLNIEDQHQRIRGLKNGPRTLDLDLLLYDDVVLELTNLQLPHPRMKQRAFVLLPLADIEPELILPCNTNIQTLLRSCNLDEFECIGAQI